MTKISDKIGIKGDVYIRLLDKHGVIKEERKVNNLVVTTGKEWAASQIDDDNNDTKMSHMAIGTGGTSPVVGDTTLETEIARVGLGSTTRALAVTTFNATFSPGTGTGAITEAGVFNDVSAGAMLSRVTFPVINKQADDTLVIDWDISMT
jgi:hypothetical protein